MTALRHRAEALLQRWEPYIFMVLLLLNLAPVLGSKFFPTLDGPAHLYNSNLIVEMLKGNSLLESSLNFNNEPVPNWSGHFILALLNLFLPGWLAEKMLLCFYLIALPVSFRQMVKWAGAESLYLSYLVFPFCYTFLFFLGFYNFCLSLVFLFFAIACWLKHRETMRPVNYIVLALLVLLTYFSHVFVFVTLCIALGVITAWQAATSLRDSQAKIVLSKFGKHAAILLLAALPALAMAVIYFSSRTLLTQGAHIRTEQLINNLPKLWPSIGVSEYWELQYTARMFWIIIGLATIVVLFRIFKRKDQRSFFASGDALLFVSMILLLLYFRLPDSDSSGVGFVSVRMCLLFFLFFAAWIAVQKLPAWIALPAVILLLIPNAGKVSFHTRDMQLMDREARQIYEVGKQIPDNSVVFPFNMSGNWLHNHISNYAGIDKPMLILENYEAGLNWFPLKWKDNRPRFYLGKTPAVQPCMGYYPPGALKPVPYVILWQDEYQRTDDCTMQLLKILKHDYRLVFTSAGGQAFLFELKR